MMRFYAVAAIALCLLVPALGHAEPPPEVRAKVRLKPAEKAVARKMIAAIKIDGELDWTLSRKPEHAQIYLAMAATGESVAVVAEGLKNLDSTWVLEPEKGSKASKVNASFRKVVHARLGAEDVVVRHAAFRAVNALTKGETPDPETMALLLTLTGHASPAVRLAVQGAVQFVSVGTMRANATYHAIIVAGLGDPEPGIVAHTLMSVWGARAGMFTKLPDQAPLNTLMGKLRARPEPMIAMHAILITNLRKARMEEAQWRAFQGELDAFLKDPRPAIRATAAMAHGFQYNVAAAAKVAPLLDDTADTRVSLDVAWTGLSGDAPMLKTTPVGVPTRVQHAAVQSLMLMALRTPNSFDCGEPDFKDPEPGFAACLTKARAWWASEKGAK